MPKLTQDAIRRYVGDTSFERGREYARNGMVEHGRRSGDNLKADCHGSRSTPYRVSATVRDGSIVEAQCSCPVGSHCKHIAALLLTWLDQPDLLTEVEETHASLEKRSKAELVALVEQMLLRNPEMESLLDLPLPTGEKKQPVNPKVYQRQASAAFQRVRYEYEWGAEDEVARDLDAMLDMAQKFLKQGDPFNAAAIYQSVSEECIAHYEELQDESGTLGNVVNDCVTGLGECLRQIKDDAQWRDNILHTLFNIYRADIQFGGVGLGEEASDFIMQHATPDERKQVVAWVREAMQARGGDEWSSQWKREAYGGFLIQLQQDELDDEAYLKLCRESQRWEDLVNRLLSLGRLKEATAAVREVQDFELLQLADIFVQHKRADVAERLVNERAKKSEETRLIEWLKQRYAEKGDLLGALALARQLFAQHPSLEQYKELHQFARQLQNWHTVRAELISQLERAKQWHLLTEIYLDEQAITAALLTVQNIKHPAYGSWYYGEDISLQVARAAEATHPREAMKLYVDAATRLIDQRSRDSYRAACEHLVRVRALYKRLDETPQWQRYLTRLQEEHKTLRALKNEMTKAKLLAD